MSTAVDLVKSVCRNVANGIPGVEVIAPLPVWDSNGRSMGVQIKAPRLMGPKQQECEVTASFVLTVDEVRNSAEIARKATIAVQAMQWDVQVVIKPARTAPFTGEEMVLGDAH